MFATPLSNRSFRALASVAIAAAALGVAVGSPAAASDSPPDPDSSIPIEPVDSGWVDINDVIDWGAPPPKTELKFDTAIKCVDGTQMPYVVNKSAQRILIDVVVDDVTAGAQAVDPGDAAWWPLALAENSSAQIDVFVNGELMFADWITVDCLATDVSLVVTVDCDVRAASYEFTNAGDDAAAVRIVDNHGLSIDVAVAAGATAAQEVAIPDDDASYYASAVEDLPAFKLKSFGTNDLACPLPTPTTVPTPASPPTPVEPPTAEPPSAVTPAATPKSPVKPPALLSPADGQSTAALTTQTAPLAGAPAGVVGGAQVPGQATANTPGGSANSSWRAIGGLLLLSAVCGTTFLAARASRRL